MKLNSISRGRIHVRAPQGWLDITDEVGGDNAPFTLARAQGLGALQLSVGVQRAGGPPQPTPQDLLVMGREIAAQRGLHTPLEERVELSPVLMGQLSFHAEDAFVRLWVVFDGVEFVAASYVCGWEARDREVMEAELVVRNVMLR
jgi:hypothetical protein